MTRRTRTILAGLIVGVSGLALASACADSTSPTLSLEDRRTTLDQAISCRVVLEAVADLATTSELDRQIVSQLQRARNSAVPSAELDRLGWLLVSKARRTNDGQYFWWAARTGQCLDEVSGDSAAGMLLEGHGLYNLHRFAEAEAIARRLIGVRTSAFDYGLLGATLLSQGQIDEAADAYQRMVDLRPGLQAYSRAAHIRWLTGDLDGARELMAMAARAGSMRDAETLAWALSESARFELLAGHLDTARSTIEQAIAAFPTHVPSLRILAQLDFAENRFDRAVTAMQTAVRAYPSAENLWALRDALIGVGDRDHADAIDVRLRQEGALEDPRTTALYLATLGVETERALSLARREIAMRADPHTQDALGWAMGASGDLDGAARQLDEALADGVLDPRIYLHAGVVARAQDRSRDASRWLELASRHRDALLPSEQAWLDGRAQWSLTTHEGLAGLTPTHEENK